jgi:hypothetical protein
MTTHWYFVTVRYETMDGRLLEFRKTVKAVVKPQACAAAELLAEQEYECKRIVSSFAQLHCPIDTEVDENTTELVDERIFSWSDMADFANEMAQNAWIAGFNNSKSLEGKTMEEYIADELDNIEGS